jgi:hypothetical protein
LAADKSTVQERIRVLKQLVRESLYVVDSIAVADAILLRAQARRTIAVTSFRSEQRGPHARSFRRDRDARSFRLVGAPHLRAPHR